MIEGALVVALVLVVSGFTRSDTVVELSVDGGSAAVETRAETVAELLDEQGVVVHERDFVEPPADTELASGDAVTVRHARQVEVVIEGEPTQIWTTALTVENALDQFGVRADLAEVSASRSERVPLTGARIGVKYSRDNRRHGRRGAP
jgi:uncharacterized protein YabE (DUF348 family)